MSTRILLEIVLNELDLRMAEFMDFWTHCSCDYVKGVYRVGVAMKLSLVQNRGDLESAVKKLRNTIYAVPESYAVEKLRDMFVKPGATAASDVVLR